MQGGSWTRAIVQSLKNMRCYKRSSVVTEWKTIAHQAHRSRVKRDLKRHEEIDGQPYEGLDAWDIY
jgi:hypothetical protein